MASKSAIEKRLADVEAKARPKKIETLADFVRYMAAKQRYGVEVVGPSPPLSPEMEACFERLRKSHEDKQTS